MVKHGKSKTANQESKKPITLDPRFASVHSDPRFKLPNLKKFRVKVDDRFSKKELEKLSVGFTGKRAKIDKYGRKLENNQKNLDKFYEHEDEESDDDSGSGSDIDNDSDNDSDSEPKVLIDRARGIGVDTEELSEISDSDSDLSDSFEEELESDIELEPGKVEEGDASSSFAIVNMDWDNLTAVDLMAALNSFVPNQGSIESVAIYPSEFGKEQMQKEEIEGPSRDLFKKKTKKHHSDNDDSDLDLDVTKAGDLEKAAKILYEEDDAEDYDSKALRRYQLQRLRYYYAVVKCDSIETALAIYKEVDGTEYESTANIFDLRYIPEDMEFDDDEIKDKCTGIPATYKPNTLFVTDALQHSKVKLTWDETPKERMAIANKSFSQKEIDEMDFKAYLASDSDDGNDLEETKSKYQSLLAGSKFGKSSTQVDDDDEEDDVDMEITFDPGLNDKRKDDNETEEDTLAAYKRKQKERRKARLEKFKQEKQVEEPQVNEKNSKKHKKSKSGNERGNEELELLIKDNNDEGEDRHFNMKDIRKAEKKRGKKSKKHEVTDTQDNFEIDLNDNRFQEVFEQREYNIDPSNTDFKKSNVMKKILKERSKRQEIQEEGSRKKHKLIENTQNTQNTNELNTLVNKLKRKHSRK